MASRKKSKLQQAAGDPLSKQEMDKLICYRFAQCHNACTVAGEFGVSRMYVARAWARLPKEQQEVLFDTSDDISEELNQKIIDAERIAGDGFVRKVIQAREMAADELLRRFKQNNIKGISDKDFTSLLRLVSTIPADGAEGDTDSGSTFRQHRESIREEIENLQNTDYESE